MIVKVCGMRCGQNIREVEAAGIDWIGFICYERSPRFVLSVPDYLPVRATRVGVFVNATLDYIRTRAMELGLTHLQLHGDESPELCRILQADGFHVIKAFRVKDRASFREMHPYVPYCSYFLFDTPTAGYGGSGQRFDWSLLDNYTEAVPFLLSGGLRPDMLDNLATFHHPSWAGIDLNSGFEISPGLKDIRKIKSFVEQFKSL